MSASTPDAPDNRRPSITGNTLRVYLYLVKHSPCELREVQHGLDFKNASLASYHLKRLAENGYVKQDEFGRYLAENDRTFELLGGYSKLGAAVVPQSFFFSIMLTVLVAFFGYESLSNQGVTLYLLAVAIAAIAALWYETLRLWRRLATWN